MLFAEILLSIIMVASLGIAFSIPKWKNVTNETIYNAAIICTAVIALCQTALLIVYKLNGAVYEYVGQIITIIPWLITLTIGISLKYRYRKSK